MRGACPNTVINKIFYLDKIVFNIYNDGLNFEPLIPTVIMLLRRFNPKDKQRSSVKAAPTLVHNEASEIKCKGVSD